jgi:phage-related baseplate assembly protein
VPDAATVANNMIQALAAVEPQLDTSIGTPVRKILDVVAEQIAASYADQFLANYTFDINSKAGDDLDDFVLMFGFTRFQAQRAVGVVTFSRPTVATQDYGIPAGTQVVTTTGTSVLFSTTAPAVLPTGSTSVDVPVQAVVGGSSGNLPIDALTSMASPSDGVTTVTNNAPTIGGTDFESDDALRTRFKATVFRSLSGTVDMYLALALEGSATAAADQTAIVDQDVIPDSDQLADAQATQANVLGASQRWREQVQIGSDGTATSIIPANNVKYIFPGSSIFGSDIDAGSILTLGVHYDFHADTIPPTIESLNGSLEVGAIYDLEFEYTSAGSRNDPANGIVNRVDVWVNGGLNFSAAETTYIDYGTTFTSTVGSPLNRLIHTRLGTNVHPTAGNYFVKLGFGPIQSIPAALTIAGTTYNLGTDYWGVYDNTATGMSAVGLFGLEWLASHAPPDGSPIPLVDDDSYIYNALPGAVQAKVETWRLVTQDVVVHQARRMYLRLNFIVVFLPGYDPATVQAAVKSAMANFLAQRGFDAAIQVSDLIVAAHAVEGVDNIRISHSDEPGPGGHWGIEQTSIGGNLTRQWANGSGAPTDVQFGDDEVPVLLDCTFQIRAANSYGAS